MPQRLLTILLTMIFFAFTGCNDDEIDQIKSAQEELEQRVAALELWQQKVNSDIASIQSLIDALDKRDYVTGVTPLNDNSGYIINFYYSGAIIIKNGIDGQNGEDGSDGKDGYTPIVSVKLASDGNYYWTIDGEWLYDSDGNKIRANGIDGEDGEDGSDGENGQDGTDGEDGQTGQPGVNGTDGKDGQDGADGKDGTDGKDGKDGKDGNTPQMRINPVTNEWEVSTDNGITWTSTGVKATGETGKDGTDGKDGQDGEDGAQGEKGEKGEKGEQGEKGDSWFSGVDTTNPNYITVSLTNGTTLTFPRYKALKIGTDDSNDAIIINQLGAFTIPLQLPDSFDEQSYVAIVAHVITENNMGIATRSNYSSDCWIVNVAKPTFSNGKCNNDASVTLTPPGNITAGETALLNVAIINSDGSKTEAARPMIMSDLNNIPSQVPHIYIMTDEYVEEIPDKENYMSSVFRVETDESHHELIGKITLRGRGNSTWNYPKKPYRLKFEEKVSLCGMAASKNYVLIAHHIDPTLMSNPIAFKMAELLGMEFVNSAVPVEVTLNGKYRGAYMLTEQIQISKTSVNIDEENSILFELDSNYDEEWQFMSPIFNLPVMVKDPDMTQELFDYWKNDFEELERNLAKDSIATSGYHDMIDVKSLADFLIVFNMTGNRELLYPKSVYLYKTKGDKYKFGPVWDFDWAYGYHASYTYFHNENPKVLSPSNDTDAMAGSIFFRNILKDPRFIDIYKDRWEYYKTYVHPQILDFIPRYASLISESVERNSEIYPNTVNHSTMTTKMVQWLDRRIIYLDTEITTFR